MDIYETFRARNATIDDFVKNAIAEFTKFDELHGYPTVGDCEDILKKVAERLKAGESSEKQ